MAKLCKHCNEVKELTSFPIRKTVLSGRGAQCKSCKSIKGQQWTLDNKERKRELDARNAVSNRYRKAEAAGKYYAIKAGSCVSSIYDAALCTVFYTQMCDMNAVFGRKAFHVDHIIPLSQGGLHCQTNLQLLTAAENASKGNSNG